jgi:hypothetical protein
MTVIAVAVAAIMSIGAITILVPGTMPAKMKRINCWPKLIVSKNRIADPITHRVIIDFRIAQPL